jgi:hypothetical protein
MVFVKGKSEKGYDLCSSGYLKSGIHTVGVITEQVGFLRKNIMDSYGFSSKLNRRC